MGGALALLLAATEPERVRLLVLVDSIALPVDRSLPGFGWPSLFTRYATAGHLRALAVFLTNAAHPQGVVNLAEAAHFALRANLEREIAVTRDAGVCSVVLGGERDRLLPISGTEALASRLDADLHVVADADHDWTVRDPLGFADLLEAVVRAKLAGEPCRAHEQRKAA